MRSSTLPARVSQSRSRYPLRWLRRSALRSPCPAPHSASLSNSITRWAAKPIISRRNVASEPFSRSVGRAICSSVIVVILGSELRVQPNPTQDRHDGCCPARLRRTLGGRSGGPVSSLLHHHQGHDRQKLLLHHRLTARSVIPRSSKHPVRPGLLSYNQVSLIRTDVPNCAGRWT